MLARLFRDDPAPWVLKGGYALELRFKMARSTVDIESDLAATERSPSLGFAGIEASQVRMIAREQFAEKVAYTLPRNNPNSRVRDLVDRSLLIGSGGLDQHRVPDTLGCALSADIAAVFEGGTEVSRGSAGESPEL